MNISQLMFLRIDESISPEVIFFAKCNTLHSISSICCSDNSNNSFSISSNESIVIPSLLSSTKLANADWFHTISGFVMPSIMKLYEMRLFSNILPLIHYIYSIHLHPIQVPISPLYY